VIGEFSVSASATAVITAARFVCLGCGKTEAAELKRMWTSRS
jgi:hypothetical protein